MFSSSLSNVLLYKVNLATSTGFSYDFTFVNFHFDSPRFYFSYTAQILSKPRSECDSHALFTDFCIISLLQKVTQQAGNKILTFKHENVTNHNMSPLMEKNSCPIDGSDIFSSFN